MHPSLRSPSFRRLHPSSARALSVSLAPLSLSDDWLAAAAAALSQVLRLSLVSSPATTTHQDRHQAVGIWTNKAWMTMKGSKLLDLKSHLHLILATTTLFLEMKMKAGSPHWCHLISSIHY